MNTGLHQLRGAAYPGQPGCGHLQLDHHPHGAACPGHRQRGGPLHVDTLPQLRGGLFVVPLHQIPDSLTVDPLHQLCYGLFVMA